MFFIIVGTDWTKWVKRRSMELLTWIVQDRQNCLKETRESLDNDRIKLGEKWEFLEKVYYVSLPVKVLNDPIAPGNVFLYEED